MEKRSPFRIYGNHIKTKGLAAYNLGEACQQMIASWDPDTIKDMYYEFSIDQLKRELAAWQFKGRKNVCRALYDLVSEKDV